MFDPPIDSVHAPDPLHERRERVFLIFAGIFVGSMAMLNVIGITRFIHIGPLAVAVGVLPYPLTFLCTDFISEFYGKRRANFVVLVGLLINALVLTTVWLSDALPSVPIAMQPPWQTLSVTNSILLPNGETVTGDIQMFHLVFACTRGAVVASMVAYLAAQFCDVYLFHFWKRLTRGKHLWLRNNGSTMVSQLVDSVAVILITFGAGLAAGQVGWSDLLRLIRDNYLFKFCFALADTIPFYVGVIYLTRYLKIDPTQDR